MCVCVCVYVVSIFTIRLVYLRLTLAQSKYQVHSKFDYEIFDKTHESCCISLHVSVYAVLSCATSHWMSVSLSWFIPSDHCDFCRFLQRVLHCIISPCSHRCICIVQVKWAYAMFVYELFVSTTSIIISFSIVVQVKSLTTADQQRTLTF